MLGLGCWCWCGEVEVCAEGVVDAGGGGGAGVEALLGACCVPCLGDYAERLVGVQVLVIGILLGGSNWS